MLTYAFNEARIGRARRVIENGVRYLVAPLTSLVPGVLCGSKGALYYPPEEVQNSTESWNGVPLMLDHPYDEKTGAHLSARDDGVWDRQGLGEIRNSSFAGKLKHEAWFIEDRTAEKSPLVHRNLLQGIPIGVSTGLYTDNESKQGTFNGRPYEYIARNYVADHMAILPTSVGACSINDGCGVLVNKNGKQPTANGRGGNPKPCDDGT